MNWKGKGVVIARGPPVGGSILLDRISRECPDEIPSMPLPTVDKEFLPSDLLKLPRSPNVDGPKKNLCWVRCFRDSPFRRRAAEWVEQDQRAWPVVAEPQSALSSSVRRPPA